MGSCAACHRPLVLEIQSEDDQGDQPTGSSSNRSTAQTIPDDVELQCACHFHWQCLLDGYQISNCHACTRPISTISSSGNEQVLCNLHNEGGLQPSLDILPILAEESYLKAYPEERKCRAFLQFCREGDLEAIVDLLNHVENRSDDYEDDLNEEDASEDSTSPTPHDLLRYQDPIGSMYSGLHIAVINEKIETIWLLLLLASRLEHIPVEVSRAAETMGISRSHETAEPDIRTLVDADGWTAFRHAQSGSVGLTFDIKNLIPSSS